MEIVELKRPPKNTKTQYATNCKYVYVCTYSIHAFPLTSAPAAAPMVAPKSDDQPAGFVIQLIGPLIYYIYKHTRIYVLIDICIYIYIYYICVWHWWVSQVCILVMHSVRWSFLVGKSILYYLCICMFVCMYLLLVFTCSLSFPLVFRCCQY